MEKFITLTSIVMPLDRSNVDTDAIIPKQFLKSIKRTGFGPNLFDEWRYLDHGEPGMDNSKRPLKPDFILNLPRYANAEILLARENFGCGSSREHAPWALLDYGFRCIIAPSFADIFFNNCFKNSILPIVFDRETVGKLFAQVENQPAFSIRVDLPEQTVGLPDGTILGFEIESDRKYALLNGLDDIARTLEKADLIREYETRHQDEAPWLFKQTTG